MTDMRVIVRPEPARPGTGAATRQSARQSDHAYYCACAL